ncbi:histidine phosphatase family protein [Actinophytocola sp.]|uniref:histidine phosphatase family protein n=1 Tax=Actinophytocola sp. TaxID=1872138 RepID=UPI002D284568|nr:histidine phosphatase family protein [Actinophytocola sp.]HYQ65121.1 histidine phosphatase family protein [Actinophytocola sp.]
MLRAWLIRHGESESNAGTPSTVPGASPLTARGREQAERVAAALPEQPALIVTSPYLRAVQTAEPTVARFPDVRREEWPVQEFTYLGDLHDRLTTSEERWPYVVEYWNRADPHLAVGGAESFAGLIGRINDCIDRLTKQPTGPVAVFTHGIFMHAVAWVLLTDADPLDMRGFQNFSRGLVVDNGAVFELRFPDGAPPVLALGATW